MEQVDTLIKFVADFDDGDLRRPCPGREKLGDGSVGALVAHTADNYLRIAGLPAAAGDPPAEPRRGHRPRVHGHRDLPASGGGDADALRDRLTTVRRELDRIADLDDRQLDSIPPEGSFRFCDGRRNLEEVLTALLTHQGHQVDALERDQAA